MTKLCVKEVAEARKVNQSQLQRRSGVTMPLLRRYWYNQTSSIDLEALGQIAKALRVKSGELLEDEEKETM